MEIGETTTLAVRDKAMLELFYSSGLRLSELTGLDRDGVNLRDATVRVTGKGSQDAHRAGREPRARRDRRPGCAQREALARGAETALFVGKSGRRLGPRAVQARLKHWALKLGLSANVHPHVLRHSFASHVLQSSGDLRAVQEMLGHASISTTQVYTHLDFQHLAKVYDAAHPRATQKGVIRECSESVIGSMLPRALVPVAVTANRQSRTLNKLILKPGREKSLKRRHPWVFSGAVGEGRRAIPTRARRSRCARPPASSWPSPPTARTRRSSRASGTGRNAPIDARVLRRAHRGARLRERRAFRHEDVDRRVRLVHGESDGLPGVIADRYGDAVVVQLLSAGRRALARGDRRCAVGSDRGRARVGALGCGRAASSKDCRRVVGALRGAARAGARRHHRERAPVRNRSRRTGTRPGSTSTSATTAGACGSSRPAATCSTASATPAASR